MNTNLCKFESGELYLFSSQPDNEGIATTLWGIFDRRNEDGTILLAAASNDLVHFDLWTQLPADLTLCRLSSRHELRNFSINLGRITGPSSPDDEEPAFD